MKIIERNSKKNGLRKKKKTVYGRVSTLIQGASALKQQQARAVKIYLCRLRRFPWNAPKCKAQPIEARLLEKSVIKALQKSKQGRKILRVLLMKIKRSSVSVRTKKILPPLGYKFVKGKLLPQPERSKRQTCFVSVE